MLKAERLQAIVDITNKEKIVTSEELMRQLNISKATARRDIEELSSQGLIQKPAEEPCLQTTLPWSPPL